MYYIDQNYKVNRKIKEEVDKNQIGYEEPQSEETPTITIIKRVAVYITDKKGNILTDVDLEFDNKTIKVGKYGLVLANIPNETSEITASKEGYKTATANIIVDSTNQTHEFFLALASSDEESEVISTDNTKESEDERFLYGNILFQPELDGNDEITSWYGTNITEEGVYSGKGSFLTEGWDNSGLWELEFEVAYETGEYGYVGHMPICSEEINPFTDAKGREYSLFCWEGWACVEGMGISVHGVPNYKYQGRQYYHKGILKKVAENKLEYYFDENMWEITANKLPNLSTLHIGIRHNPNSGGGGTYVYYKNIKVTELISNSSPKNTQSPAPEVENNTESSTTYSFTSYGDSEGVEEWGTGTIETTGITNDGYTELEIKTNSAEEAFIGQKFYITSNFNPDNTTIYQLYSDAGETPLGFYIKLE